MTENTRRELIMSLGGCAKVAKMFDLKSRQSVWLWIKHGIPKPYDLYLKTICPEAYEE